MKSALLRHGALALGLALVPPLASQERSPEREVLEAEFARAMTGATLLGHFTLDDAPDQAPQPEAYHLGTVEKMGGDLWRFEARIEYGGKSTTVPLNLEVQWAGDTPVITLTDLALPMLGTFTSRVVIYGDQYAGIWSGAEHGGHLFGRVVRADEAQEPK